MFISWFLNIIYIYSWSSPNISKPTADPVPTYPNIQLIQSQHIQTHNWSSPNISKHTADPVPTYPNIQLILCLNLLPGLGITMKQLESWTAWRKAAQIMPLPLPPLEDRVSKCTQITLPWQSLNSKWWVRVEGNYTMRHYMPKYIYI